MLNNNIKSFIIYLMLIFSSAVTNVIFAQDDDNVTTEFCKNVSSKKAIALYNKGIDKRKYSDKKERMDYLNKAIELDSEFVEPKFALAQELVVSWKLGKIKLDVAEPLFMSVISLCPDFHADPYYYLAFSYYEKGINDSAKKYLNLFLDFKSNDESKFSRDYDNMVYNSKMMLQQVLIDLKRESKIVPFDPKVFATVSGEYDDFLCYVSADDSMFYFTRRAPFKSNYDTRQRDEWKESFMYSKKDNSGKWSTPQSMPDPFNVFDHEGGPTITINGKRLYYTVMADEGTGMNADIYYSDLVNGDWSKPEKVPNINLPQSWDSQPTVSPDGNTLFFASNREGGLGGTDLYLTRRNPQTGEFSPPLNLGPLINTKGDEKCPFLHADGETLYFSSEGRPEGYGGLDMYYTRLDDKTSRFKTPENIGQPINSAEDDAGLIVSTDGNYGYFAAEPSQNLRGKGIGRFDIYKFELYPDARPSEVTFLRGVAKSDDGKPVNPGKVEIKNSEGTHKVEAVVDTLTGEYVATLNKKHFKTKAIVVAKKEDHVFSGVEVSLENTSFSKPPEKSELNIHEIKLNQSWVLNDIHYKTNSAELEPRSYVMLNEFADWMKEHKGVKVEIGGHTDNLGSESSNLALSTDRAFTVKAYIQDRGVEGQRIATKGFGGSKPIADNKTETGRAQNRRTEFKILSK
jgi:outer membrane protein OmpA-like peptidoglycan-associated protein